jgi:hypothetical protein
MRCWTTRSGSFWWHSWVIYPRTKCTNLVPSVIPCQCLWTVHPHHECLASVCIDKQVIRFCRIQDELVEWREKCFESNLNLQTQMLLISKLGYRTGLFSRLNLDDD